MAEKMTAVEIRRAYQREWRAKNKDKVKAYNQKFWERRAEKARKEQTNNDL